MITLKDKLLEESRKDLLEDFDELYYLVSSQRKRLDTFVTDINKVKSELRQSIVKNSIANTSRLIGINEIYLKRIEKNKLACRKVSSIKKLEQFYQEKLTLFELIRAHYSETASLITCIDWQSPTFLHSQFSLAGKQTGRIVGTENDYKRDQHLDGLVFQNSFRKEYIDSFFKLSIQVFATSSGMSAFTTVLNFLQMKHKINGPILIGKSIYFENKTLVKSIFKNVVELDEENTQEVCVAIRKLKPSVVIFDSLSNTAKIPIPNLNEIIKQLTKVKRHTYFLVDNTGLSISSQVLKQTIGKSIFLHTIVFESLNKYYQFGMDRVTGGIFWILGKEGYDLFRAREFSGTNISDASSLAVPTPSRKLLTNRLSRLERNTKFIAHKLQNSISEHPNNIYSHIVYPGLPNHSSFSWTKNASFHGSFFNIAFKPNYQKISVYKKFVEQVIKEAKKQNIDIVSGTSFGFNTTRIYLTATHSEFGEPFVRVSVGTEPRKYIEKLGEVFTNVFSNAE